MVSATSYSAPPGQLTPQAPPNGFHRHGGHVSTIPESGTRISGVLPPALPGVSPLRPLSASQQRASRRYHAGPDSAERAVSPSELLRLAASPDYGGAYGRSSQDGRQSPAMSVASVESYRYNPVEEPSWLGRDGGFGFGDADAVYASSEHPNFGGAGGGVASAYGGAVGSGYERSSGGSDHLRRGGGSAVGAGLGLGANGHRGSGKGEGGRAVQLGAPVGEERLLDYVRYRSEGLASSSINFGRDSLPSNSGAAGSSTGSRAPAADRGSRRGEGGGSERDRDRRGGEGTRPPPLPPRTHGRTSEPPPAPSTNASPTKRRAVPPPPELVVVETQEAQEERLRLRESEAAQTALRQSKQEQWEAELQRELELQRAEKRRQMARQQSEVERMRAEGSREPSPMKGRILQAGQGQGSPTKMRSGQPSPARAAR